MRSFFKKLVKNSKIGKGNRFGLFTFFQKKMAKSNWINPWHVESIQDFYFLNCPECFFKTKIDIHFQEHAVESHPLSVILFGEKDTIN